ncbi:MAG: isocitrate/isopropylmalate dehydrogenase family protein [Myxococcaceae bacterium]
MSYAVTLIPGDGIGEEITHAMRQVIDASGVKIDWDVQAAGLKAVQTLGSALPEATLASIRKNQVALKGPTTTPVGTGHKSANVLLRQSLDLYASVRPVKSIPGIKTRYENVDLIIVRENTEGLYVGQEVQVTPETVISLKIVTEKASRRIAEFALGLCEKQNRKLLTVGHKANIIKLGDGLFLRMACEQAQKHAQITTNDCIVDALCMKLVMTPERFDVLLLENLYGDILSDLCAGLVGGLGLVPGANLGDKEAVFEAVHGSAPDIAGQNKANPTALIKSAAMMLDYLGEKSAALNVDAAVNKALTHAEFRTGDLGGTVSTAVFTQAVIKMLA